MKASTLTPPTRCVWLPLSPALHKPYIMCMALTLCLCVWLGMHGSVREWLPA